MQFVSRSRWPGLLAALSLFLAIGCSGNGPTSQPMAEHDPSEVEVVQITPVNLDGYNQTIERFKGKVIVVDWWFFT